MAYRYRPQSEDERRKRLAALERTGEPISLGDLRKAAALREAAATGGRRRALASPERAPPANAPEHLRARYWRLHVARLTLAALAKRLHMTIGTIADYEAGRSRRTGRRISSAARRRYRLLCAALDRGLDRWYWPR